MAFYVGGLTLLAAVMWTVFTTREHPPETLADGARVLPEHRTPSAEGAALMLKSGALWTIAGLVACALAFMSDWAREIYVLAGCATAFGAAQLAATWLRRQGRASLGVLEVVEDMLHMPQVLIRLAVVQFFTWFGLFAMWIYTTPAVTARHYGATDPTSAAYNQGADRIEAQAQPMPMIGIHSRAGSSISTKPMKPRAPMARHRAWLARRPIQATRAGSSRATRAATPL